MDEIIQFGKYRGQPFSVLDDDPAYVRWLIRQDWMPLKWPEMYVYAANFATRKPDNLCAYHQMLRQHAEDFSSWESEFGEGVMASG